MNKLSRILVPTDFSPACDRALGHAAALATRTGAELHVLHVQVLERDRIGWATIPNVEEIERIIADATRKNLDQAIENIQQPAVHEVLRDIKETPAILRYIEQREINLVVMGTHARKGLSRMFLGSVASGVVRGSQAPVIVIGPGEAPAPDAFRHVLAAIDFSDNSRAALQQAAKIAQQHDAELSVVHVVEPRMPTPYDIHEPIGERRERAVAALDERLQDTDLAKSPEHKEVLTGPPASEITTYAQRHDTDLIVMGTVGLSGLGRLLFGSTTARVLPNAPCAVLAHRGPVLENL